MASETGRSPAARALLSFLPWLCPERSSCRLSAWGVYRRRRRRRISRRRDRARRRRLPMPQLSNRLPVRRRSRRTWPRARRSRPPARAFPSGARVWLGGRGENHVAGRSKIIGRTRRNATDRTIPHSLAADSDARCGRVAGRCPRRRRTPVSDLPQPSVEPPAPTLEDDDSEQRRHHIRLDAPVSSLNARVEDRVTARSTRRRRGRRPHGDSSWIAARGQRHGR